jgi:hypothetical protein
MLRKAITLGLIGLAACAVSVSALAAKPGTTDGDPVYNGNGAPSGPHYNLNLIGKRWVKSGPDEPVPTNGNGHRIFVRLGSDGSPANTKIMLGASDDPANGYPCGNSDFCVTDYDGTDGWAEFFLPTPDGGDYGGTACDGTTDWTVYARAVGNSGGADMYTCASDGDYLYCGSEVHTFSTGNGAPKFTNVSRELFYVRVGNVRYPIFGDDGYDYWWEYDNKGLKLAQLRFYQLVTVINDLGDDTTYECTFPTTTTIP